MKSTFTILKVFITLAFVFNAWMPVLSQDNTTEQLALQYFNSGEFEKAAELYGELFRETPNTFYYNYYLNSLLESKQYRAAERLVRGLSPTRQLRRNFTVELGYIYMQQGERRRAEREFERALNRLEPTRLGVTDLANAFLIRRLPEYAMRAYQEGRKVVPDGYGFHLELANVYQSMRDYASMMDEYLDLIAVDENRVNVVQNTLQHLMNTFNDENFNRIIRTKILERAQRNPNMIIYGELLLWYTIQQKEFELALTQAMAMERRTRDEGEGVLQIGELAASNSYYDVAIEAFRHVKRKGPQHFLYHRAEMLMLEARFSRMKHRGVDDREEIQQLAKEYARVIEEAGRRATTITLMRNYAHLLAFYLEDHEKATDLLEEAIQIPNVSPTVEAQCKVDLADIYLMTGEVWEASLLYSQVERAFKYDPVGFDAKLRNAKLSFYIGEFEWAKNQLDVLRAATSKLIANDAMELSLLISDNLDNDENIVPLAMYARADLYVFRKRPDLALEILDSLSQLYPYHNIQDEVLLKKAEIMVSQQRFEKADSLLDVLLQFHSHDILADNALLLRARIHDYHLNQPERALELYKEFINKHPGSVFIEEARRRFRELRSLTIN